MHFCLVIGEPGIGKSTAVRRALNGASLMGHFKEPVLHSVYAAWAGVYGCHLGTPSSAPTAFPGSDGLAYNAAPRVVPFITGAEFVSVICEGDRLANLGFVERLKEGGWAVDVAHLYADDVDFAVSRRQARSLGGVVQNEQWARARRTKSWNLARSVGGCIWIDATLGEPSDTLVQLPAFRNLLGGQQCLPA